MTDGELAEVRMAPDEPGHPTGAHTVRLSPRVVTRRVEHHRYAARDLDAL